jgi:dGTPase
MTKQPERFERLHKTPLTDNRSAAQIDRDRIMYSSAFRRLSNVTQVVGSDGIHVFHNRLTHSIQVAQIARRTAEFLRSTIPEQDRDSVLDPDVCEAAALAHDMGHPPFGHLAEKELSRLAKLNGLRDGFEGNAQSFRIVAKLAAHDVSCDGLDLTRATLNAVLKYPWLKGGHATKKDKWGAYDSERDEFDWARKLSPEGSQVPALEAQIMDWADDVTYSVHDVEDFYKAGLIPLSTLNGSPIERSKFCAELFVRQKGKLPASEDELTEIFDALCDGWVGLGRFTGRYLERQTLKMMSSALIGDFVRSPELALREGQWNLQTQDFRRNQIFMLKQLTWHYVILNPELRTLQHGQRRIIEQLFQFYLDALTQDDLSLFPPGYCEILNAQRNNYEHRSRLVRTIVDMIASMTEGQAVQLCHRLAGTSLGAAFYQS